MRAVPPEVLAAIRGASVPTSLLIEMDFPVQLRICTSRVNLELDGLVYMGNRGVGSIDAVKNSPAEIAPLRFTLPGVAQVDIALAEGEQIQGVPVRLKLAIYNPDTYRILEVRRIWAGRLNTFELEDGAKTATVTVTAEHAGIDLLRGVESLYTDAEQRRLHPGDPSLQYVSPQVEQRIIWPSSAWGRQ